jgi:putative peptidoglycan lipid II flippase
VAVGNEHDASFLRHARLISGITLLSRIVGLVREQLAARYFGADAIWSAFQYAFTIPNLFRKLLGEGALAASFIPLYEQAVRDERDGRAEPGSAGRFAGASVRLLLLILGAVTIVGEAIILTIIALVPMRSETLLAAQLTAVMLPYVMLVCAAAFLSGVLQVHRRFGAGASTSVVLNVLLIIALAGVAAVFELGTDEGRRAAVWWMALAVLGAGFAQIAVLAPSLRAVGFRLFAPGPTWSPAIRGMLIVSIPVALGAGLMQFGVVIDKQISLMLASSPGHTHFELFGRTIAYPMQEGALARLNWAQFMYQFPLGVFATAMATAIFPQLSGDAGQASKGRFRAVLERGVEGALLIGLPASAGMAIIAYPAIKLLFEQGQFAPQDTLLTARSTAIYAAGIWAFSVLQIVNRGYYAMRDTTTPLIWIAVNLVLTLAIKVPLLWTPLAEAGMAVGTTVAFSLQAVWMSVSLARRTGAPLGRWVMPIAKMLLATGVMSGVCLLVDSLPMFDRPGRWMLTLRLALVSGVGAGAYFAVCRATGLRVGELVRSRG